MTVEKPATGSGLMESAVNCIKMARLIFLSNYFIMFRLRGAEGRCGRICPVQFIHSLTWQKIVRSSAKSG